MYLMILCWHWPGFCCQIFEVNVDLPYSTISDLLDFLLAILCFALHFFLHISLEAVADPHCNNFFFVSSHFFCILFVYQQFAVHIWWPNTVLTGSYIIFLQWDSWKDEWLFCNQVILNIHNSAICSYVHATGMFIILFTILNDALICRRVKIDNAALTTLERHGYLSELKI